MTTITRWRLIRDRPGPGAWNMAVDEAILEAVASGEAPPTLRLYAWQPACVSLGRAQPAGDVDLERLTSHGWDLVRRPTGGRAILHSDELTYAIIAPERHPLMQGGVLASYRRISRALVLGLESLKVEVEVRGSDSLPEQARTNPICFEVPSAYEITVQGKKIIGSAQVRKRQTVLQHGSLPLSGDLGGICDALQYPDDQARETARRQLAQRAATLELLGVGAIDWGVAAQALRTGFEKVIGDSLVPGELTEREGRWVAELETARYANPDWVRRGSSAETAAPQS